MTIECDHKKVYRHVRKITYKHNIMMMYLLDNNIRIFVLQDKLYNYAMKYEYKIITF